MSNTSPQQKRDASTDRTPHTDRGNSTCDHEEVHVTTRDEYEGLDEIITALENQETRSPLNDENCCDAGDKGFRTYKTDLPVIRVRDITPGILIYRATPSPCSVYEIKSEPYTNENGSSRVDVTAYTRSHTGLNPDTYVEDKSLFTHYILNKMTFLQPETVQETLPTE